MLTKTHINLIIYLLTIKIKKTLPKKILKNLKTNLKKTIKKINYN